MKAHIVLRNSTDRQARAGTVNAQRRPVRELAKRCGASELIEYVEEGISGAAPLDERDVMRKLLAAAKPGDLVCAFDLSRLTRAESMMLRYGVLGFLADAGVKIATVDDGEIDLGTVGGRITLHVKGEMASDERKKIRARLTAGKDNAAREGRKPQGKTPFGLHYDRTTRAWSLAEPEAGIRREIIRRVIAGESTNAIAKDLNRRRVAWPARKGARSGWDARRVWGLATDEVVTGVWKWNGQAIPVPPLVDADTFARAQIALRGNQERGRRRTQHVYLLDEGHGRCALCQSPLHIAWGNTGADRPYYVCAARRADKNACALPWWPVAEADRLVWEQVRQALERPDLIKQALSERAQDGEQDGGAAARDIERGEKRLKQLADARAMLIRQATKGNIEEAELDRELARIGRESKLIGQTLAAARAAADRARVAVAEISTLKAWLRTVRQEVDRADEAERRAIVRGLAPLVELDERHARIGLKLRSDDGIKDGIASVFGVGSCRENHCETSPAPVVDLFLTVEKTKSRVEAAPRQRRRGRGAR